MIGVYSHLLGKVFRFHYHSQKTIASLGYRNVLGEFLIFETGWYIFNSIVPSEEITYPTFGRGQSSSKVPREWIYIYMYMLVTTESIFTIPNFSKVRTGLGGIAYSAPFFLGG